MYTLRDTLIMLVPPLEGLWCHEQVMGDGKIENKEDFHWTSMIRQPEFVTEEVFAKAKEILHKKKPELDLSIARLEKLEEGLCAQIMHIGAYDDEPQTIRKMQEFIKEQGYEEDISATRKHHEIYLGDPRKIAPEKLKTVIRHPIKSIG